MSAAPSKIQPETRLGPKDGASPAAPPEEVPTSTLDRLRAGQEGFVVTIEGEPVLRRRLLEAGFVPGSAVHFLMATPFGDPLVFSLRGTQIALRQSDARHVRIRIA